MTFELEFDPRAWKEWKKLGDTVRQQPGILSLKIGLVAQSLFRDRSRRHHHMRMVIANVAGVVRRMNGEIHRRTVAVRQILRELSAGL